VFLFELCFLHAYNLRFQLLHK